jgi:F-type H+-transporting ATPase subunit c
LIRAPAVSTHPQIQLFKGQDMDAASAKLIGAGLAAIALAGVGVGIGNIFATLVSSIARNPAARDQVFGIGILGFALTEAVALYALLISFLLLFTF